MSRPLGSRALKDTSYAKAICLYFSMSEDFNIKAGEFSDAKACIDSLYFGDHSSLPEEKHRLLIYNWINKFIGFEQWKKFRNSYDQKANAKQSKLTMTRLNNVRTEDAQTFKKLVSDRGNQIEGFTEMVSAFSTLITIEKESGTTVNKQLSFLKKHIPGVTL
jgi:hypothetical protein